MKIISKIYHFLGGIYFAIMLIAAVTFFVIAGTFIESFTESHRYAALFTYSNPVFIGLLWGFFVNILFSSLRRWPFRMHHVPFLITHLGLLMILGGLLVKSYYGLQGSMSILEGSANDEIFIADTHAVRVDKKKSHTKYYDLNLSCPEDACVTDDGMKISIVEYAPNAFEVLETWIKGNKGYISGLKPFPVYDWRNPIFPLVPSTKIKVLHPESLSWNVFAGETDDIEQLAKKIYLQEMNITIKENQEMLFEGTLESFLASPIVLENKILSGDFVWNLKEVFLNVSMTAKNQMKETIRIDLLGNDLLKNRSSTQHLGASSIKIDLKREPSLVFLKDSQGEVFLFVFGPQGQMEVKTFSSEKIKEYIAYERGFGGYAIQTHIPLNVVVNKNEKENGDELYAALNQVKPEVLVPPLLLLQEACEKCDENFAAVSQEFLETWNRNKGWLLSKDVESSPKLAHILQQLEWKNVPVRDRKSCFWLHTFFTTFDPLLLQGANFYDLLKEKGWPLFSRLDDSVDKAEQLTAFTQQVFAIADQLPDVSDEEFMEKDLQKRLLSAYLRAYSIHLYNLTVSAPSESREGVYLETPLTWEQVDAIPHKKLESNRSKVKLMLRKGKHAEFISLVYDSFGQDLKKPIFDGEYLIRYQPKFVKIPYSVRLREARQVNYANSSQPYSFESDLIIRDQEHEKVTEKTISMNNVYETWDGYRFYLSNILPSDGTSAKRIQVVVNYDPAKYWLTYPGAIILTLGIFLLFWNNRK